MSDLDYEAILEAALPAIREQLHTAPARLRIITIR